MTEITLTELRKIIKEAIADHMRLPKGPNSRDDANDRNLDDPMNTEKQNLEATPT